MMLGEPPCVYWGVTQRTGIVNLGREQTLREREFFPNSGMQPFARSEQGIERLAIEGSKPKGV